VGDIAASADIQAVFQAGCATTELKHVPGMITAASADLNASFMAIGKVSGSI
jgi:hypothetical protein